MTERAAALARRLAGHLASDDTGYGLGVKAAARSFVLNGEREVDDPKGSHAPGVAVLSGIITRQSVGVVGELFRRLAGTPRPRLPIECIGIRGRGPARTEPHVERTHAGVGARLRCLVKRGREALRKIWVIGYAGDGTRGGRALAQRAQPLAVRAGGGLGVLHAGIAVHLRRVDKDQVHQALALEELVGKHCFRIDQDRLGFVIADVSGKGVPAAIFMAISRTVIRTIALTENSASMCMQRSNNILCQESVNDMFVTVFYGILNIHTGTVTYSNAGHNPPILMKKDGSVSKVPSTGDMILGAINDASYHEKELKMSPGDNLFLYTDGVTEAMNTKHELYSEQRLLENCRTLAGKNPKEVVEKITETVGEFVVGAVQSDDITLLSISYKG